MEKAKRKIIRARCNDTKEAFDVHGPNSSQFQQALISLQSEIKGANPQSSFWDEYNKFAIYMIGDERLENVREAKRVRDEFGMRSDWVSELWKQFNAVYDSMVQETGNPDIPTSLIEFLPFPLRRNDFYEAAARKGYTLSDLEIGFPTGKKDKAGNALGSDYLTDQKTIVLEGYQEREQYLEMFTKQVRENLWVAEFFRPTSHAIDLLVEHCDLEKTFVFGKFPKGLIVDTRAYCSSSVRINIRRSFLAQVPEGIDVQEISYSNSCDYEFDNLCLRDELKITPDRVVRIEYDGCFYDGHESFLDFPDSLQKRIIDLAR